MRELVSEHADISNGIALTVDLAGDQGRAGRISRPPPYRRRRCRLVGGYPIEDYWDPIYVKDKRRLILDPDQFYILASKEAVHVPPTHAAEMVPFNPLVGEFRVHYAGFMDPGFGHAAAGGTGARRA